MKVVSIKKSLLVIFVNDTFVYFSVMEHFLTFFSSWQLLSDKDPGESIVRPSSRGPSFLTLTLKIYDGVYAHKDIVEGGKEHKDITSLLRIGKTLKIGEDTFEDLDEVSVAFCYL